MSTREIQEERVRRLNGEGVRGGGYVLCWMQQAQRAEYNHALEYAVQHANKLGQPLLAASVSRTTTPARTSATTPLCSKV